MQSGPKDKLMLPNSPTQICNSTYSQPGGGDGDLNQKLDEVQTIFQELDKNIPRDLRDFNPDEDLSPEDLGITTNLREKDIVLNPCLFQTTFSKFDRA